MGGVNGCCLPRFRDPVAICSENHAAAPGSRSRKHRRNLSAAFNLAEAAECSEMAALNVNAATEEELMTLPGINRSTAHQIVDYRRQIGGFKKVEDLALVSGVGATKLNNLRLEITVKSKRSSQTSSRSSSLRDMTTMCSIPNSDSISKASRGSQRVMGARPLVPINSANVFSFMTVKGISQAQAECIVMHRDKKGPFKCIDELLKVKGFSSGLLSAVRHFLVLHEEPIVESSFTEESSFPNNHDGGGEATSLMSLYGPLAKQSFRKKVAPVVLKRDGRQVLRLATWNLECLTKEKASNPGVRDVICMTILEAGVSLLALQDINDAAALQVIADELNCPVLPNVRRWKGGGKWCCLCDDRTEVQLGFLYNSASGLQLESAFALEQIDCGTGCCPLLTRFCCGDLSALLLNFCASADLPMMEGVLQQLEQMDVDYEYLLAVGHFKGGRNVKDKRTMKKLGFQSVSTEGKQYQEMIWIGSMVDTMWTGETDVVENGLSSPWIPCGWLWGGRVSEFSPLWTELFTSLPLPAPQSSSSNLSLLKMAMPMSAVADL